MRRYHTGVPHLAPRSKTIGQRAPMWGPFFVFSVRLRYRYLNVPNRLADHDQWTFIPVRVVMFATLIAPLRFDAFRALRYTLHPYRTMRARLDADDHSRSPRQSVGVVRNNLQSVSMVNQAITNPQAGPCGVATQHGEFSGCTGPGGEMPKLVTHLLPTGIQFSSGAGLISL